MSSGAVQEETLAPMAADGSTVCATARSVLAKSRSGPALSREGDQSGWAGAMVLRGGRYQGAGKLMVK